MSLESRPSNSLFKRKEQLKRWEDSETNRESAELPADKPLKIKFSDGCVFLAACAAGDTAEVERLLAAGADINTTNVDGLTALHQACIDDNMAMVEFLVEHGCDLNLGDNEGWTPLHATASCGFVSVARYLIENGADVSRVNNDGDLPIDIAESEEMEELLQAEVDRLNVDCEAARNEEERLMLEDAKQMLNNSRVQDKIHPRTGATSLHVAAAKGYLKVMSLLIQAGVDLNAQDVDGWTPLHAAAHWGQKGACRLLCENLANMALPNYVGQTCFDLADPDVLPVLEELRKKQDSYKSTTPAEMQKERPEIQEILERKAQRPPPPLKRRTSVTRMSLADKNSVVVKDTSAERTAIEAQLMLAKVDEEAERKSEEREIRLHPSSLEERQVARKNEVNRAVSNAYADNKARPPAERGSREEEEEEVTVALRRLRRPSPSRIAAEPVSAEVTVAHPGLVPRNEAESPPVVVATITIDEKKKEPAPPTDIVTLRKPLRVNTDTAVTDVTTAAPSTPPSAESITKRTFVLPVRDEESETQRKAHAKRVRETRRSTQGVTLEDVKSAEQQLLKRQQELEDRKEDKPPPAATTTTTAAPTTTTTTTTTPTTTAEELVRRHSWRNRDKEDQEAPAVRVVPSSPEGTPTVTLSMPRARGQRVTGSAATDISHTVTVPVRPRGTDDTGHREGTADGDREDSKTNAAISRRRRPKRRSTGVVYLDDSAGGQESLQDQEASDREKLRIGAVNDLPNNAESAPDTVRGRSGSAGSLADSIKSETESRLSSSAASLQDDDELDYKKLYTELKEDYDRLKVKLSRTEDELDTTRRQLEKAQLERRALERKISEMEEELKVLPQLKAENAKLKAENRALTRVVSNLSK